MQEIVTRFVLIGTAYRGNVGSSARALKTMGFNELSLVSPVDTKVLKRRETIAHASGAIDVLSQARIVATLEEAVEGTDIYCGTAMPHDMSRKRCPPWDVVAPRPYFHKLVGKNDNGGGGGDSVVRISFLFGNEQSGMSEDDLKKCHVILGVPTNPVFGSLNLSAAVQLVAYDWREAIGGYSVKK